MRPSLLTWLCTSLSAGFASVGWSIPALLHQSRASSTSGTVSSAAYPCVELLTLSYHILSLKLAGSRSATLNQATALLSARSRASESHHRGFLCFSWHVWSLQFLRDLDLFLNLRQIGEFSRMFSFHLGHFSCRTREQISAAFLTVITRSSVRLSISVWFQRLYHNLVGDRIDPNSFIHEFLLFAGETGIERPNSLFHDLVVRFDLLLRDCSS